MISVKLLFYLAIGTAAMLIPIMIQSSWYNIKWYKSILIAILLTVAGTIGTYILYYIENGWIGGTSFFGAVFFVPLLFFGVAKMLKMPYGTLMDICAPAECIMLSIMKVQCLISGCCGGRGISFAGNTFVFPSQIAEMINALIIMIILMAISRKERNRGLIFPYYMVIYGISRFVLNIFRDVWVTTDMIIPYGNIWSIVSIIIGVVAIVVINRKAKKQSHPLNESQSA